MSYPSAKVQSEYSTAQADWPRQWRGAPYSPWPRYYWDLTIRLFSIIYRTLVRGSYPSAEKQSMYCTAPADWTRQFKILFFKIKISHYVFLIWDESIGRLKPERIKRFQKLKWFKSDWYVDTKCLSFAFSLNISSSLYCVFVYISNLWHSAKQHY